MKNGVAEQGLKCVAVLMGAYSLQSGLPVLGVVFEPFCSRISEDEKLVCVKCVLCFFFISLLVLFKY